jgi:Tfp pilus assembly protein PilF
MGRPLAVLAILASLPLSAAQSRLELRVKVTGFRTGFMRIGLRGVENHYEQSALIIPGQEFKFHSLETGSYILELRRRALGSIRRTVVVTPSLADKKGIVRVSIPYVPAEAALEGRGTLVSQKELSVPDRAWGQYQDAARRLAKNDTERAEASLLKAIAYAPQFSAAWNALGVISFRRREYPKAEEYFRKALAADSQSFSAQVNLGGALLAAGRWKEALVVNQKAQSARPQDALANAQLGLTYFQLGDDKRAEPYLMEAQRIDPAHFTRPQIFLASIYLARGDTGKAASEIEDYAKRYPDAPDTEVLRQRLRQVTEAPSSFSKPR